MIRIFYLIFILMVAFAGCRPAQLPEVAASKATLSAAEDRLQRAYGRRESGFMAGIIASVIKVLPDDNDGSRHQRFLIQLSTSQTILVSHNIDLAPRIEDLKSGTSIKIYGQYEWNEKGGAIHWTHHDPAGRHEGGWIEYNGQRYQ